MSDISRPARILIVDDSAVMRSLLRAVVTSDPRLEVAGTASDGASGLRAADALRPDLILLDVEMPVLDGLGTLRQLRARNSHIPVIMCSTLTHRGAKITIEALAGGAADYVAKPSGQPSREAAVRSLAHDLIPKILALTTAATAIPEARSASSAVLQPVPSTASRSFPAQSPALTTTHAASPAMLGNSLPPAAILIGVSTGGPAALDLMLPELPADFPLPILIVQHMPELFTRLLAERLNSRCSLHVHEAVAGEAIRPGNIYIAQGGRHMEIAGTSPADTPTAVIRLTGEAPVNHCRPAVDVLFRSAVAVYGSRILGLVLTGMGYDGLAGCRLIRQHGGTVFVQDQPTSAVWGMPGAVAQAGLANRILPLNSMATEILRLISRGQREAVELRESVV